MAADSQVAHQDWLLKHEKFISPWNFAFRANENIWIISSYAQIYMNNE